MKYLLDEFGGDLDLAVAAYNGGPSRILRSGVKFESFQYLIGVGDSFHLLKNYMPCLRKEAGKLKLLKLDTKTASWEALSKKTGISELELRFFNPFLAQRGLKAGVVVAYPEKTQKLLISQDTLARKRFFYKVRLGEVYHYIANIFGLSYDDFRKINHLFFYGRIQPGTLVEVTGSPYAK